MLYNGNFQGSENIIKRSSIKIERKRIFKKLKKMSQIPTAQENLIIIYFIK